jgi:hypothetical protein
MSQVTLAQLILVNMIIDIYGFASRVPSQFFDEISGHASSKQVSHEPVAAAMRSESILQFSAGFMQANAFCMSLGELLNGPLGDPRPNF